MKNLEHLRRGDFSVRRLPLTCHGVARKGEDGDQAGGVMRSAHRRVLPDRPAVLGDKLSKKKKVPRQRRALFLLVDSK